MSAALTLMVLYCVTVLQVDSEFVGFLLHEPYIQEWIAMDFPVTSVAKQYYVAYAPLVFGIASDGEVVMCFHLVERVLLSAMWATVLLTLIHLLFVRDVVIFPVPGESEVAQLAFA